MFSPKKIANDIKRLVASEKEVSEQLFVISAFVTIVIMFLFLVQFFTRGAFPPQEIGFFYLGVVLIYSLHKEMVRWIIEENKTRKQGEIFVYGWVALTLLLFVINFFSKDYFSYSQDGEKIYVLKEVASITLQVLAIFLITRALKLFNVIYKRKHRQ